MSSSVSMEKGTVFTAGWWSCDFPSVTEQAGEALQTGLHLNSGQHAALVRSVTDVFKVCEPTCHRQKLAPPVLMQVSLPPGESQAAGLFKEIH